MMASSRIGPLTRRLLMLLLAHAVGVTLALHFVAGTAWGKTAIAETVALIRGQQGDDSWRFMSGALDYTSVRSAGGATLYDEMFFARGLKFVYPPTSLLFLKMVRSLAPRGISAAAILNALSIAAAMSTACLAAAIFRRASRLNAPRAPVARLDAAVQSAAIVALGLTFYPVMKGYSLGQMQALLNALFSVALWCWLGGRVGTAGAAVALMALVKPQYAAILVWAAVRRQWRAVAAGVAVIAVCLCASIAVFGWPDHVAYLRVMSFVSRRGEAFYPNQAFGGAVQRWLGSTDSLRWSDTEYPPFDPMIYGLTTAVAVALVGLVLWRPPRPSTPGDGLDLGVFTLALTIGSPLAWEHHYGVMLPIFAVTLAAAVAGGVGRLAYVALAASYVLSANVFAFTNDFSRTPLRILQSPLLAGALVLLALIYYVGARTVPTAA